MPTHLQARHRARLVVGCALDGQAMRVSACLLGHTDVKTTIPGGSYRGDIGEGSVVRAADVIRGQ